MQSVTNLKLANEIYDAFNAGDLDRATAIVQAACVLEVIAFGSRYEGPDGFRAFMQNFRTAFPDIAVHVRHQVASDSAVVTEFRWTGTHTGLLHTPAGELPPTDRRVESTACEVWDFEGEEIVGMRHYSDAATLFRQLGISR